MSHPLAHAKIQVELTRLMTQRAVTLHDIGEADAAEAANVAKYSAAEAGILTLDQAIQTQGQQDGHRVRAGRCGDWSA